MITREVIAPRMSRLAIVSLIALVATTGALACASLVAGERDRSADVNWVGYGASGALHDSSISDSIATIRATDNAFNLTAVDPLSGRRVFEGRLARIEWLIVTDATTYEIGVTLPGGEHHDVMVCPGGNLWPAIETRTCTTYDLGSSALPLPFVSDPSDGESAERANSAARHQEHQHHRERDSHAVQDAHDAGSRNTAASIAIWWAAQEVRAP